jgi:exosortase
MIAALVVTGLLYWRVLLDMAVDWWTEPALSHGLLLPPLAAYVAWLRRDVLLVQPARRDWRGVALTAAACTMLLLGHLAAEFFLMRFSFVVLLAGLLLTFWGAPRVRVLAMPLLLLAAMVPLPALVYNRLAAPLQLLASDVATRVAQWLGVSVYRDGNLIHLAGATLGVAEACSGLHSLSALVAGSILLGYVVCTRTAPRVALVLLSAPLAILVNIVRVAGTAVAADFDHRAAMGFYHSFSGWLVFAAGFALLYLSARLLQRVATA